MWIDVKERKPSGNWSPNHPDYSEEVLLCNSCAIDIGYYSRKNGIWYVGGLEEEEWIDKITHWMPLPKTPHDE